MEQWTDYAIYLYGEHLESFSDLEEAEERFCGISLVSDGEAILSKRSWITNEDGDDEQVAETDLESRYGGMSEE